MESQISPVSADVRDDHRKHRVFVGTHYEHLGKQFDREAGNGVWGSVVFFITAAIWVKVSLDASTTSLLTPQLTDYSGSFVRVIFIIKSRMKELTTDQELQDNQLTVLHKSTSTSPHRPTIATEATFPSVATT